MTATITPFPRKMGRPSTARLDELTSVLQDTQIELACSLAERAIAVANMRPLARAAQRALSSGHDAAAAMWIAELTKLLERESSRAAAAAMHQTEAQKLAPALELVRAA